MTDPTAAHEHARPVLYMDFDGVLNFDASKSGYRHFGDGFGYLRRNAVYLAEGFYQLQWSGELVRKLTGLHADWVWLTSWREYAKTHLDHILGVNSMYSLDWAFDHRDASHEAKFAALIADIQANPRPFVWVDDVATVHFDEAKLLVDVPFLLVAPHHLYGISRTELAAITDFVERYSD